MSHIVQVVTWILNNKTEALADVASIIGAASIFVASLAKLTALLLAIFPGLKIADDKLHASVAWLNALANSPWLNAMALNPAVKK